MIDDDGESELERRKDYPILLNELIGMRHEITQQRSILLQHIKETQELTNLWIASRWFVNALKFAAITAGTFSAAWFSIKQFMERH